ncbi:MAG: hypothetical protein NZM00_05015, partial [Anaerolinea sp.]|nr:hypothetical protein [Anaerolinea sp.]
MTGAHFVVENVVPFSQVIYAWLCLRSLQLEAVVQHDRVERNYLAWETVRKQTNPFFETGTGFEGYLIGRCPDAAAALDETVDIGQRILDAIRRMYRFEYGFRARLMATLLRERADSALIAIWAEYLGAELGRLRAQVVHNDAARQFQARTYHIVETLPPMYYRQIDDAIRQRYAVGSDGRPPADRLKVTLTMLKPGQQDAWLVVENIGQFGHPLIR